MDKKSSAAAADDGDKCRSLVCDPSGIIIAEMVYRCMICHYVSEAMAEARHHYQSVHMQDDDEEDARHHEPQSRSTESMLYKDKTSVNRSLQQQYATKHQARPQPSRQSLNHANPLIPDVKLSLYDDDAVVQPPYKGPDGHAINLSSECHLLHDRKPHATADRRSAHVTYATHALFVQIGSGANHTPPVPHHQPTTNGTTSTKSGYVTCAVCSVTRYYSCVQRRYGQFTCVTCYRYFRTFLLKPKRYACPSLGECALNVRTRCRACWIKACISVFSVDARRQAVIQANLPVKRAGSIKLPASIPQQLNALDYTLDNHTPAHQPQSKLSAEFAHENGDRDDADSPNSLSANGSKDEMYADDGMDMLEPEVSLTEDGDGDMAEDGDDKDPGSPLSEELQDGEVNSSLLQQDGDGLNKLIVVSRRTDRCAATSNVAQRGRA